MWQRFYEAHRDEVEVVAVAMDVQGAEVARPYVEKAKATYPTLVDSENVLGDLLGLKAVPNIHLIDEAGRFRGKVKSEEDVLAWLQESDEPTPTTGAATAIDPSRRVRVYEALAELAPNDASIHLDLGDVYAVLGQNAAAEAAYRRALALADDSPSAHFRLGRLLLAADRKAEALEHLRRALALDPGNYVIRKQIWAIEHPDRFYEGGIDWDWQREQMRHEAKAR